MPPSATSITTPRQYPTAVDYYARALRFRPSDAAVRTDMGTAFWYMGNADTAIAEFNKALAYAPDNPNTLFNLGLVRWKGKKDARRRDCRLEERCSRPTRLMKEKTKWKK